MTKQRWFIISLCFFSVIINYLDRSALSYSITPIEKAFHLTNTHFGFIAAGFGVGYLIMTVVGGILVDRFGARKIWSLSGLTWSLACVLIGTATGFWTLFIYRLILGIGEGPAFPALMRVTTDWLPTSERARALGFGLAAVPFASVIGAPLISFLVLSLNWRVMFFILGALGIIWAIIWYINFRDQPQESSRVSKAELDHIQREENLSTPATAIYKRTTWKFLLSNPSLLANNFAFFSFGYLLFFALTWLPGFLEQTYSVKLKKEALFLIAPWLLATVLILIGGILSDWLLSKKQSIRIARSHLIWICQFLSALCFIPVIIYHSLAIAIIFISLGIGIGLMPNAAFYALNADLARDSAATSLGIMDCSFALAGILAPSLTGMLSTLTGNFNVAIFLMMTFTILSALGIIIFQWPDKIESRLQ